MKKFVHFIISNLNTFCYYLKGEKKAQQKFFDEEHCFLYRAKSLRYIYLVKKVAFTEFDLNEEILKNVKNLNDLDSCISW